MYDQTPINRIEGMSWNRRSAEGQDSGGVRRLIADITELVELQARLVADDTRLAAASLVRPMILLVAALVVTLATLPVLMLALANVLIEQLEWSRALAQFAAAGVGLLLVALLVGIAVWKLNNLSLPLNRSLAEMEKNLEKLREMLLGKEEIIKRFEQRDGVK